MYAVFIEVNADESHIDQAREMLPTTVALQVRESGAKSGYWLAPQGGRGVSVVVYDDEATARSMAERLKVGDPAGGAEGVTFRTIEVREVLAHV